MRKIRLGNLETFAHVIELGSFSAAAERMNLSQPAVSLQVRQLETQLGAQLVERVGRKARPTAAGEALLAHVPGIDAAVSSAVDAVAQRAGRAAGRVRLGTGATACIFLLPPMLKALRRRFPDLEITVSTGNTADIVKAVEGSVIDVGLGTLPAAGRMLEIMPVLEEDFVAIAPPSIALPARVTAASLAALPLLLFEPGGNTRRISDAWFARAGVAPKPVMSLGSVEAIKELVAAGLGCAILPGMAVGNESTRNRLSVRPLAPRLHRRLAVVIRRDRRLDRGLKAMVDAMKNLREDVPAGRLPAPKSRVSRESHTWTAKPRSPTPSRR